MHNFRCIGNSFVSPSDSLREYENRKERMKKGESTWVINMFKKISSLIKSWTIFRFLYDLFSQIVWFFVGKGSKINGPRAVQIIPDLLEDQSRTMKVYSEKYPECFAFTGADRNSVHPVFFLNDPKLAYQAVSQPEYFGRIGQTYSAVLNLFGVPDTNCPGKLIGGLFSGDPIKSNCLWKTHRNMARTMFQSMNSLNFLSEGMIKSLNNYIHNEVEHYMDNLQGTTFDLDIYTSKIAYRMIIEAAMGSVSEEEFHKLGDELVNHVRSSLDFIVMITNGNVLSEEQEKIFKESCANTKKTATRMKNVIASNYNNIPEDKRSTPFIQMVRDQWLIQRKQVIEESYEFELEEELKDALKRQEETGVEISDDLLNMLVLPIVFGGHETTGHSLAWLMYHFYDTIDDKYRDQILEEVDNYYNMYPEGDIKFTIDDYKYFPHLMSLVYEVLRTKAPVISVPRVAKETKDLTSEDGSTITIPKGSQVFVNVIGVHHNPKCYENPNEFDPDRYYNSALEGEDVESLPVDEQGKRVLGHILNRQNSKCDLITFGLSPTKCLGQDFNRLETVLVAIHFFRHFILEIETPNGFPRFSTDAVRGPYPGDLLVSGIKNRNF